MLRVGLTGGMGSGKSTVSSFLQSKGIKVIDADLISREVINIYPRIAKEIKECFGEQFFDLEGNLRRRELGDFIFKYPFMRKRLEEIIIPFIKREIFSRIEEYGREGEKLCIVDAPTLIEHNLHKEMDINILVWVDKTTQIIRLKKRDNLSDDQVADRVKAQMSLDKKREFVDFIIDNSSDLEKTYEQVENIMTALNMYSK